MKTSRMVMKFDPYGVWMINRGNHILIVFHIYCCSKHKLSSILVANIANPDRLVKSKLWFKQALFNFFGILSVYDTIYYGIPLWDMVSMNLVQFEHVVLPPPPKIYILLPYFSITATSPQRPGSSVPKVAVLESLNCSFPQPSSWFSE